MASAQEPISRGAAIDDATVCFVSVAANCCIWLAGAVIVCSRAETLWWVSVGVRPRSAQSDHVVTLCAGSMSGQIITGWR